MATCGLAPVPVPSAGCGVQGQPQLLGEKETSPFLPLPKVITTNQPYYKSSVQHSYILSLTPQAGLPEDFCEFVSQVHKQSQNRSVQPRPVTSAAPQCLCHTRAAPAGGGITVVALFRHLPKTFALCLLRALGSSAAPQILKAHCYLVSI